MQAKYAFFMAAATGMAGMALGVGLTLSGTFNHVTPQPSVPDGAVHAGVHLRGGATNNDGDTMKLATGEDTFKIRLWGIDAPESKQACTQNRREIACGAMAQKALAAMVEGREVGCKLKPAATFDRFNAVCFADGKELNREMVRQGWAIADSAYSKGYYDTDETFAQKNRLGIWAMTFERPDHWRACNNSLRGKQKRPEDCKLQ